MRRPLLALAAVLASSALPLVAGPVRASGLVAAGEMEVTALTSASVGFRIPAAVSVQVAAADTADFAVAGNGRAVVAALHRVDSVKATEAHVVARFNGCPNPGCAPAAGTAPMFYTRTGDGHPRDPGGSPILSPGDYRLTVLSDGAPARVFLRLRGLSGSARLNATEEVESAVVPVATTASLPGSPSYWSGGASFRTPTADTVLLGFFQQDSSLGTAAGVVGACHYDGATPLLGHFAPGCPFTPGQSGKAQVGSVATELLTLGRAERARMVTSLPAAVGGQTAGFWSTRAGVTATPLAFFAWARLD